MPGMTETETAVEDRKTETEMGTVADREEMRMTELETTETETALVDIETETEMRWKRRQKARRRQWEQKEAVGKGD